MFIFCSLSFKTLPPGINGTCPRALSHAQHLFPFRFPSTPKTSPDSLSLVCVKFFSGPSLGVVATKWKRMRGVALTSASQWLLKQTGEDAHDGVENFGLQQTLYLLPSSERPIHSMEAPPFVVINNYTLHTGHFIDITQLTTSGRR